MKIANNTAELIGNTPLVRPNHIAGGAFMAIGDALSIQPIE